MIPIHKAALSAVGRKAVMGLSGLALVGFIVQHLYANLSLYCRDGSTFNEHVAALGAFGIWLTVAELGLAGLFLLHILLAFNLKIGHKAARPVGYRKVRSKNVAPQSNIASRNMIVTGSVLLLFLVLHIIQFRFGPSIAQGYTVMIEGKEARDLHRLVVETFKQPLYAVIYVVVMGFLGLHLRHGFWSAFQSLGLMNTRWSKPFYLAGLLLGLLMAVGFLFIPIWTYFYA